MINLRHKNRRSLSIAPSTYGFGFAITERGCLVDWGVKTVPRDKNLQSLRKVKELINRYKPGIVVLPDINNSARRSKRINELQEDIISEAQEFKLKIILVSSADIRGYFFPDGRGLKHDIAEIIAARFPEELGSRLPPRRRPWMSEDFRMGIFDAVALAFVATRMSEGSRDIERRFILDK
jgi:hypothetical protein